MKLSPLSIFLPDSALPLVLLCAGIALLLGSRKLATSLFLFVVASVVLPILLTPLIDLIPTWILWLVVAYLIFLLPFMAVALFGALVSPVIGNGAAKEMTGSLAASMVRIMVRTAFRATAMGFQQIRRMFR